MLLLVRKIILVRSSGAGGGGGGGKQAEVRNLDSGAKHADFNYDNMSMTDLIDYYYDCFKTC